MSRFPRQALASLALMALAASALAQRVVVNSEQPVLAGDPITLKLQDLKPGQTVLLRAERAVRQFTGQAALFAGEARFTADERGQVDLATQSPLPGSSYGEADVRGMLWSMRKTDGSVKERPFQRVDFSLRDEAGQLLATAQLSLRMALPEVQTRKATPFEGALFASLPTNGKKRPTLILLGGSEGGSQITRDAAHWASFGYAVLALPYYSPPRWTQAGPGAPELPGLPSNFFNIPVERLEAARDWLAQQPEADAERIGVMGTSKGAEFALIAGTRMPWIRAVAAIVPSDVVWGGWGQAMDAPTEGSSFAWKGQPLAHIRFVGFSEEWANMAMGLPVHVRRPHDQSRAAASPEAIERARIAVERIKAPVLVAGGDDDQLWASGAMAANIAASRAKAGLKTVALVFPKAGHFIGGTGTGPTTHYNDGPMKNGGMPQANAEAQAATHAALRRFLADSLGAER